MTEKLLIRRVAVLGAGVMGAQIAAQLVNAGIDTVFVLSGEGTMADIDTYQIHPTWVYPDIGTLYRKLEETV